MHIQRTKTLDRAFGFAPKQQQVIIIILTWAGDQANSKPPVKKNKNQPITNNLYQTVSLPLEFFFLTKPIRAFLGTNWQVRVQMSSDP